MEKTQNSLPGINNHNDFAKIIKNLFHDDFVFNYCWHENTTARCAIPPNLLFPLFYLMIFNNISKDSFELFKTNLKTGGVCVHPKLHHHLLQRDN